MVNKIGNTPSQEPDNLLNIQGKKSLDSIKATQAAKELLNAGNASNYVDNASISDAALLKSKQEQEVLGYARKALSSPENSPTADKVAYFSQLFKEGGIQDYLNQLSNDQLASDVLSSPVGSFLSKAVNS
jgi:hypothetical protein